MNTNDNTTIRNMKIIEEYQSVVHSYGTLAIHLPTIHFCTIVGDNLGYSPYYVRRIVNKHLKKNKQKEI